MFSLGLGLTFTGACFLNMDSTLGPGKQRLSQMTYGFCGEKYCQLQQKPWWEATERKQVPFSCDLTPACLPTPSSKHTGEHWTNHVFLQTASCPPLEYQLILPDSSVKGISEPSFQLLCNRQWLSTLCWGNMLVLWLREGGRLEFSKKDAGRPHIKDNICLSGCVSGTKQRPLARHWREDKLQSEVWPACSRHGGTAPRPAGARAHTHLLSSPLGGVVS